MQTTDEHRQDLENRTYEDFANVLREHGVNPDDGCLLECLVDAAMRPVEDLLTTVHEDD